MDYREYKHITENFVRHPWEMTRYKIISQWMARYATINSARILDIGCGDGYVGESLISDYPHIDYWGIDTALEPKTIGSKIKPGFCLFNSWDGLANHTFDIILLLDLLEHIKNDTEFLLKIVNQYAVSGSIFIITVPLHNFLFGAHDTALKHYRRYSLKRLIDMILKADLTVLDHGQFFFSLFVFRLIQHVVQRGLHFFINDSNQMDDTPFGVSQWKMNSKITSKIADLLWFDYDKLGFLPGLSGFVICKKK